MNPESALMDGIARDLAAALPVAAGRRGWAVANLQHMFERTPLGVEERWSVEVYGPVPETEWLRYSGHSRQTMLRVSTGIVGTVEAPTPEMLVAHIQEMVRLLGLADLSEPVLARSAVRSAVRSDAPRGSGA